jgi:hypothetical protein
MSYGGPGGRGGGFIRIKATKFALNGTVQVDGTNGARGGGFYDQEQGGGGAGGSLYVTVDELSGSGTLQSNGGSGGGDGGDCGGGGSGGRIAVYANSSSFTGNMRAWGWQSDPSYCHGPAGTVFTSIDGDEVLTIDNNGAAVYNGVATVLPVCGDGSVCSPPHTMMGGQARLATYVASVGFRLLLAFAFVSAFFCYLISVSLSRVRAHRAKSCA